MNKSTDKIYAMFLLKILKLRSGTDPMTIRFIHTADIHLGKTYRTSAGEAERYADFFRTLDGIVSDAIAEQVDFVLIAGDLFHTGQILPRTFARTIEALNRHDLLLHLKKSNNFRSRCCTQEVGHLRC
jgi:hypothetical protein